MRPREFVSVDAIFGHQEPTGQPLSYPAAAVGKSRRSGLCKKRADIAAHCSMKRGDLKFLLSQPGGRHALAIACCLDECGVSGPFASEYDLNACHSFAADDADLDTRFACAIGNNRGKSRFDEVDSVNSLAPDFKVRSYGEIDGL
jgi:hypothetical protein